MLATAGMHALQPDSVRGECAGGSSRPSHCPRHWVISPVHHAEVFRGRTPSSSPSSPSSHRRLRGRTAPATAAVPRGAHAWGRRWRPPALGTPKPPRLPTARRCGPPRLQKVVALHPLPSSSPEPLAGTGGHHVCGAGLSCPGLRGGADGDGGPLATTGRIPSWPVPQAEAPRRRGRPVWLGAGRWTRSPRFSTPSKGATRTPPSQLLPLVYEELRKLAAERMAQEKPGQTLQATDLVHEAYLRLVDVDKVQEWDSRGHFFAAAAESMRTRFRGLLGVHSRYGLHAC